MALATSGALTLDQIHVEAGGSSGATSSLNDTDIRGLTAASGRTINSTQGTEIDFADFYGASGASFSAISMVVGDDTETTSGYVNNVATDRGFVSSSSTGSMSPTSDSNFLGGATITRLFMDGDTNSVSGSTSILRLTVSTASVANSNSSFTSLTIDGTTVQRSAATYVSNSAQGTSEWSWNGSNTSGVASSPVHQSTSDYDPFPASGNTITCSIQ